jgi:hypothetical protein
MSESPAPYGQSRVIRRHWVHNLPELGNRFRRLADDIVNHQEKIRRKRRELELLQADLIDLEQSILDDVREYWSTDEIATAKSAIPSGERSMSFINPNIPDGL